MTAIGARSLIDIVQGYLLVSPPPITIEITTRLYTLLVPILALDPSYNRLSLNINANSTTTTAEQEVAELLTPL